MLAAGRRRRWAIALAGAVVAVASTVLGAPPASAAVDVAFEAPTAGGLVSASAPVRGVASSTSGVAAVAVAALDAGNLWLQPGGARDVQPFWFAAALAAPGRTSTAWSVTLPLAPGDVTLVALVRGVDGTTAEVARTARVATRPMLTIQLGRTMLAHGPGCQPVPGQPTVFDLAAELQRRGLFAVGIVVPARTHETEVTCEGGNRYPSWAHLAALRDTYGWSFASNGQRRLDLPRLSHREQIVESCGSLDEFAARGHLRAWGVFGPNSNQVTDQIATDVLDRCFGFTRLYHRPLTIQGQLSAPAYERVRVAGGGAVGAYDPPAVVLQRIGVPKDGDWVSLGVYKLVRGRGTAGRGWDCTSPNPAQHWTADNEMYCWDDFMAILDGLAPLGLEVVDPATVAERWGRVPPVTVEALNAPSRVAAGAPFQVGFVPFESGDHWLLATGSCEGGGVRLAAGLHRSGTAVTLTVAGTALPRGPAALRLCVRNAFGRIGTFPLLVSVV